MSFEGGLGKYLRDLNTAAGDSVWNRIMPPDAPVPAIVYQVISTMRVHSHSGPSGAAVRLVQIACWDKTAEGAVTLADQVRIGVDGFPGKMGDTVVTSAQSMNEMADAEPNIANQVMYRNLLEFQIRHEEAVE